MSEFLLQLKKMDKRFGNVHALKEVDFDLRPGEVHALLGSNGAGKSTLMKTISGAYQHDQGEIFIEGNPVHFESPHHAKSLGISIVYQEFSLINDLNVAENIYAGRLPLKKSILPMVDFKKIQQDAANVLSQIGVKLDLRKPVGQLSVGEQQIVEIAKALSTNAKVLILDEPTSALNSKEIEQLFSLVRALKSKGVGIVYITHRLSELEQICDRVTIMRDGRNIGTYPIGAKSIGEMVDLMLGEAKKEGIKQQKSLNKTQPIMELQGLTTEFLNDISFSLYPGEILGLAGQMGSGRTEIFKAIFGYDDIKSGSVVVGHQKITNPKREKMINMGIGLVSEDRKGEGILPGRSITENIVTSSMNQITKWKSILKGKESNLTDEMIAKTGLYPPLPYKPIEFLSGGNQQKGVLGRWLALENLNILLLDEPTRGIDVGAKGQIYELLHEITKKGIGILVASSDVDELVQIADRVIILDNGSVKNEIDGHGLTPNLLTKHILGGDTGEHSIPVGI
jgi:ribose transport system ATP-binding protein